MQLWLRRTVLGVFGTGAASVAVISWALFMEKFGGDRSIIGPYTMIHTANHEMDLGSPIQDQGWTTAPVEITNAPLLLPEPVSPLTLWYRQPAVKWVEALPVGNGPHEAAISPDGRRLLVSASTARKVHVLDTPTGRKVLPVRQARTA